MTRHEETINAANEYVTKTHSPSTNEFQTAMNIAVVKAYIVAAQWADKTMIDKACEWLQNTLYEVATGLTNRPDVVSIESTTMDNFINNFRKTMED